MGDDDMTLEEQIGIRVRENQEAHRRFVEERGRLRRSRQQVIN